MLVADGAHALVVNVPVHRHTCTHEVTTRPQQLPLCSQTQDCRKQQVMAGEAEALTSCQIPMQIIASLSPPTTPHYLEYADAPPTWSTLMPLQ